MIPTTSQNLFPYLQTEDTHAIIRHKYASVSSSLCSIATVGPTHRRRFAFVANFHASLPFLELPQTRLGTRRAPEIC